MIVFNKAIIYLLIPILWCQSSISFAFNLFGPRNYEDCVLQGVKDSKVENSIYAVIAACRAKFPDKSSPQQTQPPVTRHESPEVKMLSAFGMDRPSLNRLINLIEVNYINTVQTGSNLYGVKSWDYGHYLSVEVTNRNDFGVVGVEVGIPKRAGKFCSWNDSDYSEIYQCSGRADARTSGKFKCEIPRLETRRVTVCVSGFSVYANETDFDRWMQSKGIPRRRN